MTPEKITDAIDNLDPTHGTYCYDVYDSGGVSVSYCPDYQQTAVPMGYVDADDEVAKLDADDEADALEEALAALGLTIDREGQEVYTPDDSGEWAGTETLIREHAAGNIADSALQANAYDLNQVVGQYLMDTDPDERPEGALALKERLDAILSERRAEKENARSNRYEMGTA